MFPSKMRPWQLTSQRKLQRRVDSQLKTPWLLECWSAANTAPTHVVDSQVATHRVIYRSNENKMGDGRTKARFARSETVEVISKVARMTVHRSLHCLVRPSVLTRTGFLDNHGAFISDGSAPVTPAVSQPLYQTALRLSRASNSPFRQLSARPGRLYLYRLRRPRRLQYQGYST